MTKQELRQYRYIVREITQLESYLDDLKARAYSPAPPALTGMPGSTYRRAGSAQERTLDSLEPLLKKYDQQLAELYRRRLAIENAIESLEGEHRILLRYRYIDGMSWRLIYTKMHVSEATVHRIHVEALKELL